MPLPFVQLQMWDEDNQPVLPGETGNIVASMPMATSTGSTAPTSW
jgi:hypothetical protein